MPGGHGRTPKALRYWLPQRWRWGSDPPPPSTLSFIGAAEAAALSRGRAVCSAVCGVIHGAGPSSLNYQDVVEFSRRTRSFDVFGWFRNNQFNLTSPGRPQHIFGVNATVGRANSLGVNPEVGCWFRDGEGYSVAVLSRWLAERLGGRDQILGRVLTIDDRQYTVLGVMPA